ncbi:MAG: ImuA family protein [Cytophagales bacterium]
MHKQALLVQLHADILQMQGVKPAQRFELSPQLGPLNAAFPFRTFPTGAIHELLSPMREGMSTASGFICALLSILLNPQSVVVWISPSRLIFPPALKSFGIDPSRVLFVESSREQEVLWAMEEALKSEALTAVVGELREISFTASRRLQLAVEHSKVTGFVLHRGKRVNTTTCVSRWRITSLPSDLLDGLPGIGLPKWRVELLRMRNGRTGAWNLQWNKGKFEEVQPPIATVPFITKVG